MPDDPTQDVVGNFPLLFAPKTAALAVDNGSPGIVDPGDTLRYTIQVYNNGAVPATLARLADLVPNDVTYVPNSTTLNGQPVGQPDGGVPPLASGIDISSSSMDRHGVLPVPAVYAIDKSGQITYAFVEADYKVRLPADELLAVAKELATR